MKVKTTFMKSTRLLSPSGYRWRNLRPTGLPLFLLGFLLVACLPKANAQQWTIGTGTVTNSSSGYPTPFGAWYSGMREQYLYTAAELTAAGVTPGLIDELAFNVTALNGAGSHGSYNINLKGVTNSSLTSWVSGATNYYSVSSRTPVLGWNIFQLNSGFSWNGTDNILVEICFWNGPSTYTNNASVQSTSMSGMALDYHADSGGPFCSTTNTASSQTMRPNIRMTRYIPCSGSPSVSGITPAGPIASCAGAPQSLTVNVPPAVSGLTYQWEYSSTGAAPWTPIAGATQMTYNFTVSSANYYHCIVGCGSSTTTSSATQVSVTPPSFATIPYFQDFENWQNYCGTSDVPSNNWSVQPVTGNNAWRRDDQGSTANWSCPTCGIYSSPAYKSGSHSAAFNSYGNSFYTSTWTAGNMDLYLNCSSFTGTKSLYFYYSNPYTYSYNMDSLTIYMSTDNGVTFTKLAGYDTCNNWTKKQVILNSNSAQTIVRFSGRTTGYYDYSDILIDSVYVAPPCSGQPAAGTIAMTSPVSACSGASLSLSVNGTTMAGNLTYQWYQKANGASVFTAIPGATNSTFTTPALSDTIQYKMKVTCAGSGLTDSTAPVVVNVPKTIYAAIPYVESFENWMSLCNTTDIPTLSWTNNPGTGNNSWRRDDQGASAVWTSPTSGSYSPVSMHGSHSARFHSYYASTGMQGALNLYLNCSTIPGTKELQFSYINTSGTDALAVMMSVDSGATFTTLGTYTVAANWTSVTLPVTSNSPKTIIRFRATSDYGVTDIGLDYVRIVAPCAGTPSAGTVTPVTPCPNTNFSLSLTNSTIAAGLTYQWQESTTGQPGTWTNIAGATQSVATSNISAPKYFRCYVVCTNSNQADTTPAYLANIAPFYYCYCQSTSNTSYTSYGYGSVGNYTIKTQPAGTAILNNGVASPLLNNPNAYVAYTNYTNLAPTVLYRDSLYKFFVTQIVGGAYFYTGYGAVYIDLDRNGVYDPSDRVMLQAMNNSATQQISDTFRIPDTAAIGLTGMRVILYPFGSSSINPCGTYNYGETEDYLANLNLPPCDGPSNAGVVISSDTAMCAGYPLLLTDTTYEKLRSGLTRVWQMSNNYGSTWSNIPGSTNKDTVTDIFAGTTWYRLQMTCALTSDITYSNIVKVNLKPAYKCYCYSMATGGNKDTSDIGAFSIGNFVVTTGGPHLINPVAIRGRNDYTDLGPIELYVDSTYPVNIFHTMPSKTHGDGLVTLFMDFNNNLQYDIPEERVILNDSISNINGWYMINNITIPGAAVLNAPTGMRVILNNNVGYNTPSYTACGPYTSGETEDYVVVFRKGWPLGVGNIANLKDLNIYPNPTTGRFALSFTADKLVKDLKVQVTTVTGQTIMQEAYNNIGSSFNKEFNLSEHARGIYFVEITADGEKMIRKLVIN